MCWRSGREAAAPKRAAASTPAEPYPRALSLAVLGSLLGAFQFGYQVAILNTALPFVSHDLHFRGHDAALSSAVVVGAALGALTAGHAADAMGPRHAQVANNIAFVAGSLLAALAQYHVAFLAGRFIAGIGAGAASLYVPRYLAEVSPPELRGRLGSLNQVLINAGILAAYCSGLPYEAGLRGVTLLGGLWCAWWRLMLAAGVLPPAVQVLLLAWCPESPAWLEGAGLSDAADAACLTLWGERALVPGDCAAAAGADDAIDQRGGADGDALLLLLPPGGGVEAGGAGSSGGPQSYPLLLQPSGVFAGGYAGSTGSSGATGSSYYRQQQQHQAPRLYYEPSRTPDVPPYAASSSGSSGAGGRRGGGTGGSSSMADGGGYPTALHPDELWGPAVLGGGVDGEASPGVYVYGLGGGSSRQQPYYTQQQQQQHQQRGRQPVGSGWELLLARRYRWCMALALGLPLLQQASGINTVVFFSSRVFAAAGLSSPIAASIITGAVNLGVTAAAAAVIDHPRFGRKPLLLASYLGMAASLGCVAGLTLLPVSASLGGTLMVVLVLLYVACFAAGAGPVTWVLLSEVLPPNIKGAGASLATAAAWAGNLAVTSSFSALLAQLGLGGTYLLYALANAAAAGFVVAAVIETKGLSLGQVAERLLLPDIDPRLAALLPALAARSSVAGSVGDAERGSPDRSSGGGGGGGGAGGGGAGGSDRG